MFNPPTVAHDQGNLIGYIFIAVNSETLLSSRSHCKGHAAIKPADQTCLSSNNEVSRVPLELLGATDCDLQVVEAAHFPDTKRHLVLT